MNKNKIPPRGIVIKVSGKYMSGKSLIIDKIIKLLPDEKCLKLDGNLLSKAYLEKQKQEYDLIFIEEE
jgi:uridine kinase